MDYLEILPVSVIDVGAQGKRLNEDHGSTSSRANYSPFPEEIATLCYEFFLREATDVFDPFAGWGERGSFAKKFGKNYIGYDVSPTALAKAEEIYGVANFLMDSRVAEIKEFNGLITCPPYWNLERYDSVLSLDKASTWPDFIDSYKVVLMRSYLASSSGTTFCVMVGDWRKNHHYFDLEWNTCSIFKGLGAKIVDKVIVSRKGVSKIKIMLPQAKQLGYTVRVHETLLVFRKP